MRQLALIGSFMSLAAFGCANSTETTGPLGEFADGQGQAAVEQAAYADTADWGVTVGTAIPNWAFVGFANSENPALQGLQQISLSDFYNPHGYEYAACVKGGATDCASKFPDAVFPAGSPFGEGQPKPRALSVGQSAVWCGPCNNEAKLLLPGKAKEYLAKGGQFMIALVDGPKQGVPATYKDISNWTNKYEVAYPLLTDPNDFLPQLFPPSLPSNGIIRTSNMHIEMVIAGAPESPTGALCKQYPNEENCKYWEEFDKVIESAN